MKIALVGLGLAGSGALRELLHRADEFESLEIHIYEKRPQLGPGDPYAKDSPILLMNSYAGNLSLNEGNPKEFLEWLGEHYPDFAQDDAFAPREYYGEYVEEKMRPYIGASPVTVYHEEVQGVRILSPKRYEVETEKQTQSYDAVFLTMGHPPYADHYHLLGESGYIHDPYPIHEKLGQLPAGKQIGIIGSGLTGIDIMRYLQAHYDVQADNPIVFFIRDYPFSTVKFQKAEGPMQTGFNHDWIHKEREKGYIPIERIWQQFKADLEANDISYSALLSRYGKGSSGEIMLALKEKDPELVALQAYLVTITPYMPELYMAMNALDRQLFFHKYVSTFDHFRSQMPSESLLDILQWEQEGKVRIISGLKDIRKQGDRFTICMKDKHEEYADILVNAAGFEMDLYKASEQNSLIRQLYGDEIILQHPLGGIVVHWPTSRVISPRYGICEHLFLMGYWIFTTQYANNNTKLNLSQGHKVADYLINQLKENN